MTLKMNMRPVRLAATGKHLFEAPYCYNNVVQVGELTIELIDKMYLSPRELTADEQEKFVQEIKRLNAEQEKEWDVNHPIYS